VGVRPCGWACGAGLSPRAWGVWLRVAGGRASGLGRVVGGRVISRLSSPELFSTAHQPASPTFFRVCSAKGCVMAKNVGTIEHRGPIATPGRTKTPQVIGLVLSSRFCQGPDHSSSRAGAGHTIMSQAIVADPASSYAPRGVLRDYEVISTLGHGSFGKVKRE
jgi:hypothetical protein